MATVKDPSSIFNYLHALWIPAFAGMTTFYENINKGFHKTVTYHDPCDLGRNSGIYDPPRNILKQIPGLKLVELENNRQLYVCCGGGGDLEMIDPELSAAIAQRKIEEIQRTGAEMVVTSCQQCIRTISGYAKKHEINLKVMDITEVVLEAMG